MTLDNRRPEATEDPLATPEERSGDRASGATLPIGELHPAISDRRSAISQQLASISGQRSALSEPSPSPSFARGLWRIAGADVSSGNRTVLLVDGPQSFAAMLEQIEQARDQVVLESYIFDGDATGQCFADALIAAARRGVRVRVLVDWIGSRGTPRAFWRRMRAESVELRAFNPPGIRPWLGLVPRDHRKLLVADGRIGITGGFGLSDKWVGDAKAVRPSRLRWRDTAVCIDGPAAADMQRAFETMWRRAAGEERRSSSRLLVRRPRGTDLHPGVAPSALVGIIEGEPWRLRVARGFQLQAVNAQHAIWIANAYFVPSVAEVEALAGAARDSVDVRILVPSKSDHPWVRRLTRRFYRRLLRNGVRIWEWQGAMMHAKTSVVDGRWVRIGSTDFNPLGIAVNYELDAVIEDPLLGAAAEAQFLADLALSAEIR